MLSPARSDYPMNPAEPILRFVRTQPDVVAIVDGERQA
jgi:hypothetical protein